MNGRAEFVSDANNHTTTISYDANGRPTATIYADGTSSSVIYDALGHVIAQTDQMGLTTRFLFDSLGRLTSVSDPMGYITRYSYDELGDKISQIDANGHTTKLIYDVMGRLIQRTLPVLPKGYVNASAQFESRTYDKLGRLATLTDNNRVTTSLTYDPLSGYLLSKSGSNGDFLQFTYTLDGQVATQTRGQGGIPTSVTERNYDPATGRVISISGPNGDIYYRYDNVGNQVEVDTPSSVTLFEYDADNRLSTISHPNNIAVARYTYDRVGNRNTFVRGNGVTTTYVYDQLNRLTDLANSVGPSFHFTLLPDGKRNTITEVGSLTAGTTSYVYDADGHILSEKDILNSGTVLVNNSYAYDNVGNRLSKVINGVETHYSYDANDRLIDPTYIFDANGNQTTVNGKDATYDFENHLTSLSINGTLTATYTYDANGDRISQTSVSGTINYLVDSAPTYASVAEERDSNGNLIARYDYADGMISMTRGSSTWYYIFDGHDDVRALTNSANPAQITDTWAYDAFGNITAPDTGSTPNEFLYNGQQLDVPSGTYYLRARYYDQASGRFLSTDPMIGHDDTPITLHRYLYAANNPVSYCDPGGQEFSLCETLAAIGIYTPLTAMVATTAFRISSAATTLADVINIYYDYESTGTVETEDAVNLALDIVLPKIGPKLFKTVFTRWLCFAPDTPILMANGSLKTIEHIKVGDYVLSRDENTGITAKKRVLQVFVHVAHETLQLFFDHGGPIETTLQHPFYVQGKGFTSASELKIGCHIITNSGSTGLFAV